MDINALREKLDNSQYIYLYGAGLAGINYLQRFTRQLPCRPIEGIVVSEKEGNPEKIGGGGGSASCRFRSSPRQRTLPFFG